MSVKIAEFWTSIVKFVSDYILFPLVNIEFVNVLDILLLTVMAYAAYKFIMERHAGRIVLGVLLVIGFYIVSDIIGMTAISSLLKSFYTVGLIALVVLFQPEIRAALEEFGATPSVNLKKIRNHHTADDDKVLHMVEEVSAAAFELSQKREGALIVLERVSRLRNQMSEGTVIDAEVSKELLCNIFVNRSPLHDGAVIIRDCRIVSASNKSKTIAENSRLVSGLGTRHRAALKISEVSDAVVVIVSEETGTISVANNKLLKRGYNDIGKRGKHKSGDLRDDLFLLMTGKTVLDMMSPDTTEPDEDEKLRVPEKMNEGGDAAK